MASLESFLSLKRPIENSCLFTNEENPFSELQIVDYTFLNSVPNRGVCPRCHKSRRYYCYNCYVAVEEIEHKIPVVQLPVKIDIIKHPKEVDGKSTSAHAAVLAPAEVRVFTYPDFPDYADEKVLLMFPGKSAISLKDLVQPKVIFEPNHEDLMNSSYLSGENCICVEPKSSISKKEDNMEETFKGMKLIHVPNSFSFDRVVFIDSTWKQVKKLYRNPIIRAFPCAVLTSHKSVFWRHQRGKPETYLSTIEAIYYFLVELHKLQFPGVPYCGRYDNLLFFFKFMYFKIRTLYDPAKLKAYRQAAERTVQELSFIE